MEANMKIAGMEAARALPQAGQALDQAYGDAGGAQAAWRAAPRDQSEGRVIQLFAEQGARQAGAQDNQQQDAYGGQQRDGESEKVLQEAIDKANRILSGSDRKFEITIHEKTGDVLVKVVDTRTKTTVREIPPKKIVDLMVSLCELAGIMFDKKG
jgi:flagellar protein FlaG